jgi:aspartyl-tRNA(Asn)/glutamyl-tRNA(Gln) amidotransferase subunit A
MKIKTIQEFHKKFFAGEVTSAEVTASLLERIQEVEPVVRAYLTVDEEGAMAAAGEMDRKRGSLDPAEHPLAGVPLALKDLMCTRGLETTCASRILEGYLPPYDATVVERLRQAGAVILGKTNMDEFAMGSSTENSAFGATRNPWGTGRVPGGSSGGSAVAVAAGECLGSLGSDTGGSIRQPAAFCGVVGMKPTYGRVSRYGLVAFASSLDQIGPLTRTVADTAILLNVISGHDPMDSTSAPVECPDFTSFLGRGISGMTLGLPVEYFQGGIDPDVQTALEKSMETLTGLGASIREISLPHTDYAVATYYIVATAEASSNLARYDGVKYGHREAGAGNLMDMYRRTRREGFGGEVKRRIMLGTYALSAGYYDAYYGKAQKVRTLIKEDFEEAFEKVDLIITATAPTTAFRMGEKVDDPLQMYLSDIFTIPVNLSGLPAVSIPCGFDRKGLPVGLQLIGQPFEEGSILQAAEAFESAAGLGLPEPEINAGEQG